MLNAFLNIFGPLAVGYGLRRLSWVQEDLQFKVNRFLMRFFSPVVVALSFWGLEFKEAHLLYIPVIGGLTMLLSFFPALALASFLKLPRNQQGSFIPAAMFANVGFYGGYIAFDQYGQFGYNLVALYCVFFSPIYYTVGFIICEHFSQDQPDKNWFRRFMLLLKRDIVYRSLIGIIVGFVLNQWGPERPELIGKCVNFLIPLLTWLYLFLVGTAVRLEQVNRYLKPSLWLSALKFTFPVLITLGAIPVFGLAGPDFTVVQKVLYLMALCPVGVSVTVLPSLFKVDAHMANSLWLITHIVAFFLILPIYLWIF
jgi:predicted permease